MPTNLPRRDFLKATSMTASVSLLSSLTHAALAQPASVEGPGKPRLRKAVKLSMVGGKGPILEKFQLVKEAGFEGIDMDQIVNQDEALQATDVAAAMKETGLIVHGVVDYIHWGKPLSDANPEVRAAGVEMLKRSLRDCKAYGGDSVLLVPAIVNKTVSYADAYQRSQAEIRKALPLAAELKIKILFENVWNHFLLSPLEAARYVDEFESPWVGWYFDVGNVVRYGWPEQWIHVLGKRIGKIDIKEYSRKKEHSTGPGSGFGVQIGDPDGDCNWPAVMQALKDVGYAGWATAEVGGGGLDRLKEISTRMDKIFETY